MRSVQPCNKVSQRPERSVNFAVVLVVVLSFGGLLNAQFADEFTGPSGKAFDGSKWSAEVGGGGWGNEELQFYTKELENARLDGNGISRSGRFPYKQTAI